MYRKSVFIIVSFLLLCSWRIVAQTTIVRGTVKDAKTHERLPFVTVFCIGADAGTSTDEKGEYFLKVENDTISQVKISYIGYNSVVRKVTPHITQTIDVQLTATDKQLKEVVVKAGKGPKYRNRDNPAVELIRQVIEHKSQNRGNAYPYTSYEKYDKSQLSLINTPDKLKKNLLVRKFNFMASGIDTVTVEGKALLPLFLEESLSDNYYRQTPPSVKTVIKGEKKVMFNPGMIDNAGLSTYTKHIYQDVDIYENNINLLTNRFLSPISDVAPTFYKFYIIDTTYKNSDTLVKLAFSPRNNADFLFQGTMTIALDRNYAVESVSLKVSKHINLNWVRSVNIKQEFERNNDSTYHLAKSEFAAEFGLTKKGSAGMYGQHTTSIKNFSTSAPDTIFRGKDLEYAPEAQTHNDDYWKRNRHDTLTREEQLVYTNVDSLQNTASFKHILNLATMLFAGYTNVGPYFEVGPVNTFYSFNPVEGFRLRLGGRTTPRMSKRIYFETYAAYGFKDERWKYYLGTTYSFNNRSIYEFPVSRISANFQRDTKIPGQELQFVQEDNILLSIKRGINDKWLYNDIYNINYLQEFSNHFSFKVGYKNWKQEPAGGLRYISTLTSEPVNDITTSELSLELRWAPKEEFYQGKLYRVPMPNRYPVFTVRATAGLNGFLGGQYNYQSVTANIYKRVFLSQLGYTDVALEGGYVFGSVPFPLLYIHRANQTYSYQLQSYNLMNFLEFVSDHYASINIDHCFNGFVLNKLPLVKKMKLREYVSAKVLYGGLTNSNIPESNNNSLKFPTDAAGNITTFTLEKEPYVECSIGIGNLLKIFRVDVVRRFTYLDNPNVSEWGVRGRFKFDF